MQQAVDRSFILAWRRWRPSGICFNHQPALCPYYHNYPTHDGTLLRYFLLFNLQSLVLFLFFFCFILCFFLLLLLLVLSYSVFRIIYFFNRVYSLFVFFILIKKNYKLPVRYQPDQIIHSLELVILVLNVKLRFKRQILGAKFDV